MQPSLMTACWQRWATWSKSRPQVSRLVLEHTAGANQTSCLCLPVLPACTASLPALRTTLPPCIPLIQYPRFPLFSRMGHSQDRPNDSDHCLRHRHWCASLRALAGPACPPPLLPTTALQCHGPMQCNLLCAAARTRQRPVSARAALGQHLTSLPASLCALRRQASTPPTPTSSLTS
jgi:hypothetical protein